MMRFDDNFPKIMRSFLVLVMILTVSILRGQTIYMGAANGDWFLAANWNSGVPALGNDATIPTGKSVAINAPLTVNFSSTGSVDPEGQPLSYFWTFGDNSTSMGANPSHMYTQNGQYTVVEYSFHNWSY